MIWFTFLSALFALGMRTWNLPIEKTTDGDTLTSQIMGVTWAVFTPIISFFLIQNRSWPNSPASHSPDRKEFLFRSLPLAFGPFRYFRRIPFPHDLHFLNSDKAN